MRRLRFGLVILVSTTCIAAVPATSASASTHPKIAIKVNSSAREVGKPVTVSGTVSPNAHGQTIALQQRHGSNPWVTVKTMTLGTGSGYRFLRYMNTTGVFQLRTKLATFVSTAKTISVFRWHFLSDLPMAATSGGCITTGSAQIRSVTYAHTVSMDLTCGSDVWAEWTLAKGCREYFSVEFFTNASSSDAKATLSINSGGKVLNALTVAESDFDAPGQRYPVGGVQTLRLEANAPSGTTTIAAFGNAEVDCPW
jgi:hypothetical protein